MNEEDLLWRYFKEINDAVTAGNEGRTSHPYRTGTFIVTAISGDIELSIKDISEEDAVLIAGELKDMGIKAIVSGSVICLNCKTRVPDQSYCVQCRTKLKDGESKR